MCGLCVKAGFKLLVLILKRFYPGRFGLQRGDLLGGGSFFLLRFVLRRFQLAGCCRAGCCNILLCFGQSRAQIRHFALQCRDLLGGGGFFLLCFVFYSLQLCRGGRFEPCQFILQGPVFQHQRVLNKTDERPVGIILCIEGFQTIALCAQLGLHAVWRARPREIRSAPRAHGDLVKSGQMPCVDQVLQDRRLLAHGLNHQCVEAFPVQRGPGQNTGQRSGLYHGGFHHPNARQQIAQPVGGFQTAKIGKVQNMKRRLAFLRRNRLFQHHTRCGFARQFRGILRVRFDQQQLRRGAGKIAVQPVTQPRAHMDDGPDRTGGEFQIWM